MVMMMRCQVVNGREVVVDEALEAAETCGASRRMCDSEAGVDHTASSSDTEHIHGRK